MEFIQSPSRHFLEETLGKIQNLNDYLTKILIHQIINIGHQSDWFYVTKAVYLLSMGWWLPCQQSLISLSWLLQWSRWKRNMLTSVFYGKWTLARFRTLKINPLLLLSFFFLSCFHKALFYVSPFNAELNMAKIWKVQYLKDHVQFFTKRHPATFILKLFWAEGVAVNKGQTKP